MEDTAESELSVKDAHMLISAGTHKYAFIFVWLWLSKIFYFIQSM